MAENEELPVNEPKGKPGPKSKVKPEEVVTATEEVKIEDVKQENPLVKSSKPTQKEKDKIEATHEEEMVNVDFPVRASNGTITGYIQKLVSKRLAEREIGIWSSGQTGHSAWRDVKFSK